MKIELPEPSLVVLIGTTGSGKSTFARTHFRATEILSSDFFRGMVADDETDQSASDAAFELLHLAADRRLAIGRLTVIDATNVTARARSPLLDAARRHGVPAVAIVLDVPRRISLERNRNRPDRQGLEQILARHHDALRGSISGLAAEGFERIWVVAAGDIDSVEIVRGRDPR